MQLSQRAGRLMAASAVALGLVITAVGPVGAQSLGGGTAVLKPVVPGSNPKTLGGWTDPTALGTLTISYATPTTTPPGTTTFPLQPGEDVQINVQGGSAGSIPTVSGTETDNTLFTGTCSTVNSNGYSLCSIVIPLGAAMPIVQFTVTDQVALPTNQVPEVPFAAGLPLLMTLGLPLRRFLKKNRRA